MSENRLNLIKELVEFSCPLELLELRLQKFDWDFEGVPIKLSRAHLVNLLTRYLNQELSANDVEHWANLIEGREDICFESGSEKQLDHALYQLANPTLTAPLNEGRASAIVSTLA